jgi:hypothetical protein
MAYEKNIIPPAPAYGQNVARVVVGRSDDSGGAKPIAEQPGVVPDYPYQGTPAESEPTKKAPAVADLDKEAGNVADAKPGKTTVATPTYGV